MLFAAYGYSALCAFTLALAFANPFDRQEVLFAGFVPLEVVDPFEVAPRA